MVIHSHVDMGTDAAGGAAASRDDVPGDTSLGDTPQRASPESDRGLPAAAETDKWKRLSEADYGVGGSKGEYDHLVSLELGGTNATSNLWPEPGTIPNPKDAVENRLHKEVCDGQLTLAAAQAAVAANWTTAPWPFPRPAVSGNPPRENRPGRAPRSSVCATATRRNRSHRSPGTRAGRGPRPTDGTPGAHRSRHPNQPPENGSPEASGEGHFPGSPLSGGAERPGRCHDADGAAARVQGRRRPRCRACRCNRRAAC